MSSERTPPRKKARDQAKYLRGERPDYSYMKELFRYLCQELEISRLNRRISCRWCQQMKSCRAITREYERTLIAERMRRAASRSSAPRRCCPGVAHPMAINSILIAPAIPPGCAWRRPKPVWYVRSSTTI